MRRIAVTLTPQRFLTNVAAPLPFAPLPSLGNAVPDYVTITHPGIEDHRERVSESTVVNLELLSRWASDSAWRSFGRSRWPGQQRALRRILSCGVTPSVQRLPRTWTSQVSSTSEKNRWTRRACRWTASRRRPRSRGHESLDDFNCWLVAPLFEIALRTARQYL